MSLKIIEQVASRRYEEIDKSNLHKRWEDLDEDVRQSWIDDTKVFAISLLEELITTLGGPHETTQFRVHEPPTIEDPYNLIPPTIIHAYLNYVKTEIEKSKGGEDEHSMG